MGNMMQHILRELQYRCSSDSCSAIGNSIGYNNAVDEGQRSEHQQHRGPMTWINVMLLLGGIARTHSSLRGGVDFG